MINGPDNRAGASVPDWLARQRDLRELAQGATGLGKGPKLLFDFLVEAAGEEAYCYHTNKQLAARLVAKPRTIRKWLAALEDTGWVLRRKLRQGSELPRRNGEAVEQADGMRLIYIPALWMDGPMPGQRYPRTAPAATRDQRIPSSLPHGGEDRRTKRNSSTDPTPQVRADLRKGNSYEEGVQLLDSEKVGDAPLRADRAPAPWGPTPTGSA